MGDIDSPDRPVAVSVGVLGCSDGSTTSRKGISMLAFPMRRSRATCQRAAVCLLLWSMRCIASPLPTDYVTEMVAGWLATTDSPLGTPMGDEIESCETYRDAAGTPLYHVVNLKPDGYVVTPASNGIEPIIAFVASGRYEAVPSNPLFMLVEADVRRRMERVRGLGSSQDVGVAPDALSTNVVHSPAQSAKLKWEDLVRRGRGDSNYHIDDGHGVRSLDDERVPPLVPSRWNQWCVSWEIQLPCYNYYTPPYASGTFSNYFCGCTATAFAQILGIPFTLVGSRPILAV